MIDAKMDKTNFFPDLKELKSSQDQKNNLISSDSDDGNDSYEAILKNAISKKEPARKEVPRAEVSRNADSREDQNSLRNESRTQKMSRPVKMDKPKVGNREPFFPAQPMPYHPDERMNVQENSFDDESISVAQDLMERDTENYFDDQKGVVAQSFESGVFSYPVRQIAAESLDDETKQSLMQQGLWNAQGFYSATPTPQMQSMMLANQQSAQQIEKPVAQFMASMENELSVSPDRLAQAMLQLAPGQLNQPPQETMKEVIRSLELSPADQKKATQLYSKMLAEMQAMDNTETMNLPNVMPMMGAKNLSDMALDKNAKPSMSLSETALKSGDGSQNLNSSMNLSSKQNEFSGQNGFDQNSQSSQSSLAETYSNKSQQVGKGTMLGGSSSFQSELKANSDEKNQLKMDKVDLKNQLHSASNANHASLSGFDMSGQIQSSPGNDFMSLTGAAGADGATGLTSSKESRHETIQTLVNNAQALSAKGGGEMRLTLTPDHLGQIELKVSMNGSQVDVQMVAEKAETKKLIEQNIHELRNGLAQHNLSMEKIDVSLSDKNAGAFNQHKQPDFNQAREFAQQFSQNSQNSQNRAQRGETFNASRNVMKKIQPDTAIKRSSLGSGRLNIVA